MALRYFFSLRSKMVYLSLGSISSSRGISAYHRSMALALMPLFCRAELRVSTTLSTSFSRLRCRAFWGALRRHGRFLRDDDPWLVHCFFVEGRAVWEIGDVAYQSRPPRRGADGLNMPSILS